MWNTPFEVTIDGKKYPIRNNCDYRVCLDCVIALEDVTLSQEERVQCALYIFYEDISNIKDFATAAKEMMRIINIGEYREKSYSKSEGKAQKTVDWEKDFKYISSAVNKILGYETRDPNKFTHWWTFVAAMQEMGECLYSTILDIRIKKQKGKKLEKWEQEFYIAHKDDIELPIQYTEEEASFLAELGVI